MSSTGWPTSTAANIDVHLSICCSSSCFPLCRGEVLVTAKYGYFRDLLPSVPVVLFSQFFFLYFWDSYFLSYSEFVDIKIKLRVQALRPALASGARGPCHWSEGRHNNVGVSLRERRATRQVMLPRAVTAGKMGRNSSLYYTVSTQIGVQ